MTDRELWEIERGFWTKGRAHYEAYFGKECLAAFPSPTGIMVGNSFVANLPENGAWQDVEMTERAIARPSSDIAILAYRGIGKGDGEARSSICTSTYMNRDGWTLVQHQQTPVDE